MHCSPEIVRDAPSMLIIKQQVCFYTDLQSTKSQLDACKRIHEKHFDSLHCNWSLIGQQDFSVLLVATQAYRLVVNK